MKHVRSSPSFEGAILIGSFADGRADALSDLDLILVAPDGGFEKAWNERHGLRVTGAVAAWDVVDARVPDVGAHKWLTGDIVLVECAIGTPSSGLSLAEPYVPLVGGRELARRLRSRGPISRSEMGPADHPIERAYDELRRTARTFQPD